MLRIKVFSHHKRAAPVRPERGDSSEAQGYISCTHCSTTSPIITIKGTAMQKCCFVKMGRKSIPRSGNDSYIYCLQKERSSTTFHLNSLQKSFFGVLIWHQDEIYLQQGLLIPLCKIWSTSWISNLQSEHWYHQSVAKTLTSLLFQMVWCFLHFETQEKMWTPWQHQTLLQYFPWRCSSQSEQSCSVDRQSWEDLHNAILS